MRLCFGFLNASDYAEVVIEQLTAMVDRRDPEGAIGGPLSKKDAAAFLTINGLSKVEAKGGICSALGIPEKYPQRLQDEVDRANMLAAIAETALDKLKSGAVTATGIRPDDNERMSIPLGRWHTPCVFDFSDSSVQFSDGVRFSDVGIESATPLNIGVDVPPNPAKLIPVKKSRGATKITAPFVAEYFQRRDLRSQLEPTIEVARELYNWGVKNGHTVRGGKAGTQTKPTPDAIQRAIKAELHARLGGDSKPEKFPEKSPNRKK